MEQSTDCHTHIKKDLNCKNVNAAEKINLCGTPAEQQELKANSLERESHTGSSSCHISQDPAAHVPLHKLSAEAQSARITPRGAIHRKRVYVCVCVQWLLLLL